MEQPKVRLPNYYFLTSMIYDASCILNWTLWMVNVWLCGQYFFLSGTVNYIRYVKLAKSLNANYSYGLGCDLTLWLL